MNFTPNKDILEEIINALNDLLSTSPKTITRATNKMKQLHDNLSDYSGYLAFILSSSNFSVELRRISSILLGVIIEDRNGVKDLKSIEEITITGLEDPNIDYSCARLILSIIKKEGIPKLKELLPLILKKSCYGAFHIIEEICQNYSSEISTKDIIDFSEKFIKKGMDQKIHSSILHITAMLLESDDLKGFEILIGKLFSILPFIREEDLKQDYCSLIMNLFERNDLKLVENYLKLIFDFLLHCSSSSNGILIESATDCWEIFEFNDKKSIQIFEEFLTKLIPILTSQIIKVKDSVPTNILDDYEIFKKDIRRSSVEALEFLSRTRGEFLSKIILPIIKERILSKDSLVRESGILALGVLSQSELVEIYKFVEENMMYLIQQLEMTSDPIVTKTTLWTLSKYYLIMNKNKEISDKIIHRIAYFIIQEDAQIQHASLSLFITILECEELNQEIILKNLEDIQESINKCLKIYKDPTTTANLFECISTLFDVIFEIDGKNPYSKWVEEIIKELMIKLNNFKLEEETSEILSCLTSISIVYPNIFEKYTSTIVNTCLNMIKDHFDNDNYKDIIISCIDFISESIHYFDSNNFELSQFIKYTNKFINSNDLEIKQSGFGLLGELIKKDSSFIDLNQIYPILLNTIEKDLNYANNAIWTFGEICLLDHSLETQKIAKKIVLILNEKLKNLSNGYLKGTSAVTIAKIQTSFPSISNHFFRENLEFWLQTLMQNTEKKSKEAENIFKSLAITININPEIILKNIKYISSILKKWENWTKLDVMFELYKLKQRYNEIDCKLRENGIPFDNISTQQRLKSNLVKEHFTDVRFIM